MWKTGKYQMSGETVQTVADNRGFVPCNDFERIENGRPQLEPKKISKNLTVIWSKLTVEVGQGKYKRKTLSSFSGHLKSGELAAIMGPSGSGKSTFLKCLSLKQRPTSGQVDFFCKNQNCDFSYVAQTDDLYMYLTVEESLLYASQFKNSFKSRNEHLAKVREVCEQFRLQRCFKNVVKRCSGGEIRRLSMALEMVSDPDLVVMDEPTTGLDSFTAFGCIQSIKEAVEIEKPDRQLAVLMTIHQPNTQLFFMFDRVFFLSAGHCIYSGPPKDIPSYLEGFNLKCPPSTNPSDFIMDIACKGPEDQTVKELHDVFQRRSSVSDFHVHYRMARINPKKSAHKRKFFHGLRINIRRLFVSNLRDPQQSFTRLILFLLCPLLIWFLSKRDSFQTSSCVYRFNNTHLLPEISYEMFDRRKVAMQNVFYILFNAFFTLTNSTFPAAFSFTLLIKALIKEHQNNWYTFNAFFFAFLIVQILFAIFYSFANSLAILWLGPELYTWKTFAYFSLVNGGLAIFGDVLGFLSGTIFARNMGLAVMLVTLLTYVAIILSDFFAQYKYLSWLPQYIYNISGFYHAVKLMLKVTFAMEPCVVGETKILTIWKIQDFLRFFKFETGLNWVDHLEDVEEIEWVAWEDTQWTMPNVTNFVVNRNCPMNATTCSKQLNTELDTLLDSKLNLIANEFLLFDMSVAHNVILGLGLIALHYVVCYFLALSRARSK